MLPFNPAKHDLGTSFLRVPFFGVGLRGHQKETHRVFFWGGFANSRHTQFSRPVFPFFWGAWSFPAGDGALRERGVLQQLHRRLRVAPRSSAAGSAALEARVADGSESLIGPSRQGYRVLTHSHLRNPDVSTCAEAFVEAAVSEMLHAEASSG